jgi:hypothetical protein
VDRDWWRRRQGAQWDRQQGWRQQYQPQWQQQWQQPWWQYQQQYQQPYYQQYPGWRWTGDRWVRDREW